MSKEPSSAQKLMGDIAPTRDIARLRQDSQLSV